MTPNTPTVHLVDDDVSFLTATARLIRASGFVVLTFTSAADLLAVVSIGARGCVVADLHMPHMDGLGLQEALAKSSNPLPVLFLSGQGDIPTSVRAMRGGAEDFLEKRADKVELLEAVRRCLARDVREHAKREQRETSTNLLARLTDREREVLGHVVRGQLNKQIASDLGIGERTVKLHRTAITTKLGVPSVAELTRLVDLADAFPDLTEHFP